MENIKVILQTADYAFDDIIICNVHLSSMTLFSEFNNAYGKYFKQVFPARVTVVIELPPRALVEISVIAYKE